MERFTYNEPKAVAAVLFVVNETSKIDKHKLAKILFFADQKHLSRYGRTITSDFYCAMANGPVPSHIYDSIKGVSNHQYRYPQGLEGKIKVNVNEITALITPDIDQLSKTDIACLIESIEENKNLKFRQLVNKSHGQAWSSVLVNHSIPFTQIAMEASAPEDILELIKMNLDAEELLSA